ncbi:MAG: hydrogenase iron-sulfur subunit, partial [Myxococcales bacterium]
RGASGVLIAGCGPVEPPFREGQRWTAQRLAGERAPSLRRDKVPVERVRFVQLDAAAPERLTRAAAELRDGIAASRPAQARSGVAAALALGVLFAPMVVFSRVPAPMPAVPPELVVSFKHPGEAGQRCRTRSDEELASLPQHMRHAVVCERGRADVRLRVRIDGQTVLERRYAPAGFSRDGASIALERIGVAPGVREVEVALDDRLEAREPRHHASRRVRFGPGAAHVVLFDREAGFTWHGGGMAEAEPPMPAR